MSNVKIWQEKNIQIRNKKASFDSFESVQTIESYDDYVGFS